jgi:hypothetical protein
LNDYVADVCNTRNSANSQRRLHKQLLLKRFNVSYVERAKHGLQDVQSFRTKNAAQTVDYKTYKFRTTEVASVVGYKRIRQENFLSIRFLIRTTLSYGGYTNVSDIHFKSFEKLQAFYFNRTEHYFKQKYFVKLTFST